MARTSPSAAAARAMPSAPTASSIHLTSGPGKPLKAASSRPASSTTSGRPIRRQASSALARRTSGRSSDWISGRSRATASRSAPASAGLGELAGVAGDEDEGEAALTGAPFAQRRHLPQLGHQLVHLRGERREVAVVADDPVGGGAAVVAVPLGGEAGARGLLVHAAGHGAPQAHLRVRLDGDDQVEVRGVAGLDQQGGLEDDDAVRAFGDLLEAPADERVDRRLQGAPRLGVGEDPRATLAWSTPVRRQHLGAEESAHRRGPAPPGR